MSNVAIFCVYYDAVDDASGIRYQIKSRWMHPGKNSRELNVIRNYEEMGKNGDQNINWAQNATLAACGRNGVDGI